VDAAAAGDYTVVVQAVDGARRFEARQRLACVKGLNPVQVILPVENPSLWSPESPALYDTRIALERGKAVEDVVRTYFGMRKVSRGVYGDSGHEFVLLNNKPVYLRGALHQSFNPQGLYTAPDDAFLRNDYGQARKLGLNFIRIHIKVDEPRALYWADKLGVMLMCDMPNFAKKTPRARKLWEDTLRASVARDFNHPAIIAWCQAVCRRPPIAGPRRRQSKAGAPPVVNAAKTRAVKENEQ
jgi:beta-galactosidase/beta-glucuronidase